jgi:exosome complex exonuclease DIS3/RRP44
MQATQRVFVKRTRRGKVRRVVREHYLRDDILSGSPLIDAPHLEPRLSAEASRYIVPDANVLLHQMDVLEHSALSDIVLLQTVLAEVRHRRVALYNRARAIAADPQRRCVVYCNEHARESFVARDAGETANDYNDRAIRAAVEWYTRQLDGAVEVLLLTNDQDNLRKARAAGLQAQTIHAYVQTLAASTPDLADRLAGHGDGAATDDDGGARGVGKKDRGPGSASSAPSSTPATAPSRTATLYTPHLDPEALKRGLARGELLQGRLRVNRHNPREGFVTVSAPESHAGSGSTAMRRIANGRTPRSTGRRCVRRH